MANNRHKSGINMCINHTYQAILSLLKRFYSNAGKQKRRCFCLTSTLRKNTIVSIRNVFSKLLNERDLAPVGLDDGDLYQH